MISFTKLLFDEDYSGDEYRYKKGASLAKNGVAEGRGPIVVWNMTRACNLTCKHCYMDAGTKSGKGELTTAEAESFIKGLADFKVPAILFSGGEPLLRADFFHLAEFAASVGVRPTLSTNGTLIDENVAEKLKKIGVTYVGISLDGLKGVNDSFRGKAGAFDDALKGIRACRSVNQRVGLRFTINKHNAFELDSIFDFLEAESIDRVCFYHLVYSGRGRKMTGDDLSPVETRAVVDTIVRRSLDFAERGLKKEILTVDNHADGAYLYLLAKKEGDEKRAAIIKEQLMKNGGNRSGMAFGEVDPEGFVHPDQFTQHHTLGNVKDKPFGEIWCNAESDILQGLKERKKLLKGRCATCRFLNVCNGNFRTRAEAVHGDFWASDPACYLTDEEISGEELT